MATDDERTAAGAAGAAVTADAAGAGAAAAAAGAPRALLSETLQLAAEMEREARLRYEQLLTARCASLAKVDALSALSWQELERASALFAQVRLSPFQPQSLSPSHNPHSTQTL